MNQEDSISLTTGSKNLAEKEIQKLKKELNLIRQENNELAKTVELFQKHVQLHRHSVENWMSMCDYFRDMYHDERRDRENAEKLAHKYKREASDYKDLIAKTYFP